MAHVLLISANTTTEPYPVYPLGMSVVASALSQAGHTVRQFDFLASGGSLGALNQVIAEFAPDMTGISLRNIDNVDSLSSNENWYLEHVRDITSLLKHEGQIVMVGGPGFSLMPEALLDYLGADHGVVGEGERKMVRLVNMLESGDTPPRLMKPEQGLPGSGMHSPLWDPGIVEFYQKQSGIANVQTKRGCENRCSYCSYPSIEGGVIRPRDPEAVVDEIERMHQQHGAELVFFTDSVFNDTDGHYLAVAEALARKSLPVKWSAFFQPTGMTDEEAILLKRSGLHAMEVGTDASTNATLTAMNKPFAFEDVMGFNETCVRHRIPCAHFVIFGGPGETMQTVHEGIANLNRLENCVVFPYSGIRLHAGTPLFSQAKREGVVAPEQPLLRPHYYFSPAIDPEVLNDTLTRGFADRRDRIFPPSEGQDRMNVLRRFGYRGLLWDTLIQFPDTSDHMKPSHAEARP